MALTPDQTAVLELLLAGQSYSDLEDLLGLEQSEVRARARAALTELGGADPDRNVGLSDYLLRQADPIGRADAVRHLRQHAEDHALATKISERLAELAPAAELPTLPPPPGRRPAMGRARTATDAAPERRSPLAVISQGRSRLYAGLGAAAVILIAVVLGVSGVFSGGGDEPEASETTTTTEGSGDPTEGIGEIPPGEELTRIPLRSTGGGNAAGAAIVGLSTGDQPYLDLIVENLEPAPQQPKPQAYVVWFMFDDETGYPLSPIFPNEQGSFNDRFAIPAAVTGLIFNQQQGAESIEVALSDARQTLKEIQIAAQQQTFQISRPGRTVLEGKIAALEAGGGQDQG